MSESPEEPVPTPNLFLLRNDNWEFLEGQRPNPSIVPSWNTPEILPFIRIGVVLVAVLPFVILLMMARGGAGAIFMGFIAFGLASMWMLVRRRQRVHQRQAGMVLTGEVVQAESIREWHHKSYSQRIKVRYRFATPGGIVQFGEAEGESRAASDSMSPLPGTAVRVWYRNDGSYALL